MTPPGETNEIVVVVEHDAFARLHPPRLSCGLSTTFHLTRTEVVGVTLTKNWNSLRFKYSATDADLAEIFQSARTYKNETWTQSISDSANR
jgi:hypothetical protein